MRRLFKGTESGLSSNQLRWGERVGRWRRIQRNIYGDGPAPVTALDRARAKVLASGSPARGALAGVLLGLDGVVLDDAPTRRTRCDVGHVVHGTPCADGRTTMLDLAALVDDETWEQALESALRKQLVHLEDFADLPSNVPGVQRMRRVLDRRGEVAPTESLLETLMVQLIRRAGLPDPVRQFVVERNDGTFVARVDLCWPTYGIFLELDGQHHRGQPVYDANRQTRVIAATGWLVGRYTWRQVVHGPTTCMRELHELFEQRVAAERRRDLRKKGGGEAGTVGTVVGVVRRRSSRA
jgi:very-short-patch-repair endonuclease